MKIKSIGTKITIPMVFIILVTGIATIMVVQRNLQKTLIISLKEEGSLMSKHIAAQTLEPILIEDTGRLQEILEEMKHATRDFSYAFIVDRDDNIIVHTFSDGFPLQLLWVNRLTPGQESSMKLLETEEGLVYDFAVPVMLDDKMIGTARVGITQKFMKAAVTNITFISIAIILSIVVLGILIAIGLSRLIVKPIKTLQHSTDDIIETGNLEHRIEIKTGDEIEQLADSFNEMVASLKGKSDELKRSEIKYRTLVESSPDMIHLIDANSRFLSVNQMEVETLGYSLKEFYEMEIKDIISPEHIDNTKNAFKVVKEKGRATYETELISRDGKKIPVEVNAVADYDMGGNFISALGILRDITERKKAEEKIRENSETLEQKVRERTGELEKKTEKLEKSEEALSYLLEDVNNTRSDLEKANERLKELDRLKSMFIASMSHELRTPLNAIMGFTGIILQGFSGEISREVKEELRIVYNSAKHLLNLINDVIDISKIEAEQIDVYFEKINLYDVLKEAVTAVSKEAEEKKIEVRVDSPEGLRIKTDRRRLLQCTLNLLSNAVKYSEGGTVSISAQLIEVEKLRSYEEKKKISTFQPPGFSTSERDFLEISVSDTGIGIKEQDIPKLFNSFVRLDSPMKEKTSGTGLGLYLTMKIMKSVFNGEIKVESLYGEGSTFILLFPLEEAV